MERPYDLRVDRDAEGRKGKAPLACQGARQEGSTPRAEFFEIAQMARLPPFRVRPPRTPCLHNPLSVSCRCYTTYQVSVGFVSFNKFSHSKQNDKKKICQSVSVWLVLRLCQSVCQSAVSLSVEEAKSGFFLLLLFSLSL